MASDRMTDFEISRPVVGGAEDIQRAVRMASPRIFREDMRDAAFFEDENSPAIEMDDGDQIIAARPLVAVGEPRFNIYGKFMLPLMQLSAPADAQLNHVFHYAASRLGTPESTVRGDLMRIRLGYDVMEGQEVIVHCGSVALRRPPHKAGIELALVPSPEDPITTLFIEEHKVFMQALRRITRLRQKANLVEQPYVPLIPIALLPEDIESKEQTDIVKTVQSRLPARLKLGDDLPPLVR